MYPGISGKLGDEAEADHVMVAPVSIAARLGEQSAVT